MNKLTEIANKCLTDKGSVFDSCHEFTEFYYDYFNQLKSRNEKIYILEIGVYQGASLKMYNEFFEHNCEVYAIDIDFSINEYEADNVHLFKFDATQKDNLDKFFEEIGDIKFDFILDDGSHWPKHQYATLLYTYKHLKEDGKYILEDLHTHGRGYVDDSPLYFLTFWNNPKILLTKDIEELKSVIDTSTIFVRNNPKSVLNGTSVTALITFKH